MVIKVVGAVIVEKNKILIAQRPLKKSMGGYWEFPGGKIEIGESPQEALIREIKEELSCSVKVNSLITTSTFKTNENIIELSTYYCERISEKINIKEHIQIRWVDPSSLGNYEWAPADNETVKILEKELLV